MQCLGCNTGYGQTSEQDIKNWGKVKISTYGGNSGFTAEVDGYGIGSVDLIFCRKCGTVKVSTDRI